MTRRRKIAINFPRARLVTKAGKPLMFGPLSLAVRQYVEGGAVMPRTRFVRWWNFLTRSPTEYVTERSALMQMIAEHPEMSEGLQMRPVPIAEARRIFGDAI